MVARFDAVRFMGVGRIFSMGQKWQNFIYALENKKTACFAKNFI